MASKKPYRPEMDWSSDPDLLQRFKIWKKQVQDEVRLMLAEEKKKAYACMYVLVCSGEHGEDILKKRGWQKRKRTTKRCSKP